MSTYPLQLSTNIASYSSLSKTKTQLIQTNTIIDTIYSEAWWWRCNRGLPIQIQMSDGTNKLSCLCPPNYYGDQCQYQNQRVSLTLQIQAASDWRNLSTFVITLIDNEKNIESHDHIEYLSVRDCDTKFNVYLLYSTRAKNSSKTYSVQIDAFNKLTLSYRTSWIFPLQFSFLPVHRLSVLLKLPIYDAESLQKCTLHMNVTVHPSRYVLANLSVCALSVDMALDVIFFNRHVISTYVSTVVNVYLIMNDMYQQIRKNQCVFVLNNIMANNVNINRLELTYRFTRE
jgi:hypothetical protein